jgi:hypothetical protein
VIAFLGIRAVGSWKSHPVGGHQPSLMDAFRAPASADTACTIAAAPQAVKRGVAFETVGELTSRTGQSRRVTAGRRQVVRNVATFC